MSSELESQLIQERQARKESERRLEDKAQEIYRLSRNLTHQRDQLEDLHREVEDSLAQVRRIAQTMARTNEVLEAPLQDCFFHAPPEGDLPASFVWRQFDPDHQRLWVATGRVEAPEFTRSCLIMALKKTLQAEVSRPDWQGPDETLEKIDVQLRNIQHRELNGTTVSQVALSLTTIDFSRPYVPVLEFAGTHESLLIISKDVVIELKADECPLGQPTDAGSQEFHSGRIELQRGDVIYQFSGMTASFDEPSFTPLRSELIRGVLPNIAAAGLSDQRNVLLAILEEWNENKTNPDDAGLAGLRI